MPSIPSAARKSLLPRLGGRDLSPAFAPILQSAAESAVDQLAVGSDRFQAITTSRHLTAEGSSAELQVLGQKLVHELLETYSPIVSNLVEHEARLVTDRGLSKPLSIDELDPGKEALLRALTFNANMERARDYALSLDGLALRGYLRAIFGETSAPDKVAAIGLATLLAPLRDALERKAEVSFAALTAMYRELQDPDAHASLKSIRAALGRARYDLGASYNALESMLGVRLADQRARVDVVLELVAHLLKPSTANT